MDDVFEQSRQRLFGLAYRITGSISDSEDILQECFLRWQAKTGTIESDQAWLTTVVTRLALDHIKSAEEKRKSYIGPWLPEPLSEPHDEPDSLHELDQSITMALLVIMDQLSASERAAYILHDLFDYSFDEVASILDKSSAACRKLASRGRAKVQEQPTVSTVPTEQHTAMIDAFFNATRQADSEGLLKLLSKDVIFHSDGGGKAVAGRRIFSGQADVADWIERVLFKFFHQQDADITFKPHWFNGAPGMLVFHKGLLVTAFNFTIDDTGIRHIYALRNPDKLHFLTYH
ncbi:RNA polymerase sigma factor SigJ [Litoribrevibacter euphylliae]|uniref:RNA polymerase sigma factor SigJ n=1 Tax=Litoribrevibacter euphylliae TaxID=1834034 RepID=A0ABV7HKM3_9GAMM